MKKNKIKKGDQVVVLSGRDKGKKGDVLKVYSEEERVLVAGVNKVKRHKKPSRTDAGGIVESERSIHISNVALLDPKSGKATKIGYKFLDNGEKVRFARKSGEVIA